MAEIKVECLVGEIDALMSKKDNAAEIGSYVTAYWWALRAALSPSPRARAEAAGYQRRTSDALRDLWEWYVRSEPASEYRNTAEGVLADCRAAESALTASRQRAEEMERERDERPTKWAYEKVCIVLEEHKALLRPLVGTMSPDGQGERTTDVLRKLIARAESAERERDQERAARGGDVIATADRVLALLDDKLASCVENADYDRGERDAFTEIRHDIMREFKRGAYACPPSAGATEAGDG